ncbi:MAG: class I SAM-dependent methyltransferase [Pseudomonadota bacterium]
MSDTPLADRIKQQIAINGPMPVADYMSLCLLDPKHGYYTQAEPFGTNGDFITAPEISQLFGEIVGAWLINAWRALGKPNPFVLAEAGPGRGTLMRDVLRTARIDAEFVDAATVYLIEASPKLREVQRETLIQSGQELTWATTISDLPSLPQLLVSNEFFDALPARQFIKVGDDWLERCIGVNNNGDLHWTTGATRLAKGDIPKVANNAETGSLLEISPAREAIASEMAAHIQAHGGVVLHFDYSHTRSGFGDTFQAVKAHQFVDPLQNPGTADLTSHVDFEAIGQAAQASGATVFPPMTQAEFLLNCGLLERAGQLGTDKSSDVQNQIRADVQRLAGDGPNDMGELFKVLCFAQPDCPPLLPFAGN